MPSTDENPYAAPQSLIASDRPGGPNAGLGWHLAWMGVFVVNLIVPLLFGFTATRGEGRFGMAAAIVMMLVLGHLICARSERLSFLLVAGGACVGLSQFVPMLQFVSGLFAITFTSWLLNLPSQNSEEVGPDLSTGPTGFLATSLTGGMLLVASLVCGQVVFLIRNALKRRRV